MDCFWCFRKQIKPKTRMKCLILYSIDKTTRCKNSNEPLAVASLRKERVTYL